MIDNHSHLRLTIVIAGQCPPGSGAFMYVCLCNAVTDTHIRKAVADGCCSMRDLQTTLGVASSCGKCAPCAKEVLSGAMHEQTMHNQNVTVRNVTPHRRSAA